MSTRSPRSMRLNAFSRNGDLMSEPRSESLGGHRNEPLSEPLSESQGDNDGPHSATLEQASPRLSGAWAYDAVVIGASSGGIELLGRLLPQLPAGFPAAVLVVQHLRGDTRSLLHELYAPRCAIPLCEAADKQPIEPGRVYFAPPDYHLLVELDHTCALSVDDPVRYSRPSID